MNLLYLFGLFLGMVAALMLNIGKGVQKQKVHVFLQGRKMFSAEHRGDLAVWLLGLAMTASAAVPFSFGLKISQSSSTISAMTGVGLIGLTVYAVKVIGEKLTAKDAAGILIVVFCTSAIAFLGAEKETPLKYFEDRTLVLTVLPLIIILAIACLIALKIRSIHGVVFGASAGFCLGLSLFLADAALVRSGGSIMGQFGNSYCYLAIFFALMTTIVTQMGFLRGKALVVVPSLNSFTILTPILFEVSVYGNVPSISILLITVVLILGVILISAGAAVKATEEKTTPSTYIPRSTIEPPANIKTE